MINHNGKDYDDNAPIEWDVAIDIVGFYFERAQYLGLPKPPACFVFTKRLNCVMYRMKMFLTLCQKRV